MSSTHERTKTFHEAFGHPVRTIPMNIPTREEAILAIALIEEEFHELVDALFPSIAMKRDGYVGISTSIATHLTEHASAYLYSPDLVEAADAVADLDVVVNGAGLRMGLPMEALSIEVFNSNMSKLGADGAPVYKPNGKIGKGHNFIEPDILSELALASSCDDCMNGVCL